jgi:predicted short-subunit dehydrogenase-like oxidoreductase (DUF2520 family)
VPEGLPHFHIVGPGRAGLALGSALAEAAAVARLTYGGRGARCPDHPLFRGIAPVASYHSGVAPPPGSAPSVLLLAVPDDHIEAVAADLASASAAGVIPGGAAVLHLSGAFGSELLAPLARLGHPTGSLHPLVALADTGASSGLHGACFVVEGAPAALAAAREIVAALEGRLLEVEGADKPLYHAAAVAASNYVVALLAVAERWMEMAGVAASDARPALVALASGAVENVRRLGPAGALTGPVARGDTDTIRAHLARLSEEDRHLYSVLAGSALTLARQRGLDRASADGLAHLLESTE